MNQLSKNEEEIQKALNSEEFPFEESSWEAAKEMLDRELPVQKKKKKLFLWWLPVLALLIAAGWWAYSQKTMLFSSNDVVNKPTPTDSITNESASPILPYSNKLLHRNDTNYAKSIIEEMGPEGAKNNNEEYIVEGGPPALMVARMAMLEEQRAKTKQREYATVNTATNNKHENQTAKRSGQKSYQPNNNKETPKVTKFDVPKQVPMGEEEKQQQVNGSQQQTNKQTIVADTDDGDNTGQGTGITESEETKPTNTANKNATINESAHSVNPAKEAADSASNTPPVTDTVAPQPITTGTPKKEEKQILLKNSISPMLGFGYTQVLSPTETKYNNSPYYGLLYNRYLNNQWQIAAGIGYTQVTTKGLEKTYTTEAYSFGVQRDQTIISTSKLHYFQIPVLVRYAPLKRITIIGGLAAGYLLNTQNSITQTTYASLHGGSETTKAATAYSKGINNWDMQWQLGVETHFMKNRLHLGILASGGLTDVTLNTYYNNSVFDRNRRVQLFIRYDVIRF